MTLQQRIDGFVQLGKVMKALANQEKWPGFELGISENEWDSMQDLLLREKSHNGWFTVENVRKAFNAWGENLNSENLHKWLAAYPKLQEKSLQKSIGVIMAGNIPLVGFHDFLCVLLSGGKIVAKQSSEDFRMLPALCKILIQFAPDFEGKIAFAPARLTGYDAIIATGSNNTAMHFEYYFRDFPKIIRKNRTSVAILSGEETDEELNALGHDIFDYFGLGCRNVSKLYLPEGYDVDRFYKATLPFSDVINHHKYANNYDYNRAVWLMNAEKMLDNNFLLLKENEGLVSPLGALYIEHYKEEKVLREKLQEKAEDIQCIVSQKDIPFGEAQHPKLWDYADGVDTMEWLLGL